MGSSKGERENSTQVQASNSHLTTGSQLPPPYLASRDRPPSHATANDPGIPRSNRRSHAFMHRCWGIYISVNAAVTILATRLRTTNDGGTSTWGLSSGIKWPSLRKSQWTAVGLCIRVTVAAAQYRPSSGCCNIARSTNHAINIALLLTWALIGYRYRLSAMSLLRYLISVVLKISISVWH